LFKIFNRIFVTQSKIGLQHGARNALLVGRDAITILPVRLSLHQMQTNLDNFWFYWEESTIFGLKTREEICINVIMKDPTTT